MEINLNFAGYNEYPSNIKILVGGHPGSGKTRFAATFPNTLWANAACGLATLSMLGKPFVNISGEQDLLNLKFALDCDSDTRRERFGIEIDTLVIDTVDEFQRLLLLERLRQERRTETTPSDWGWLGQRMHAIFEGISSLPLNIVFVCHLKEVTDDSSHLWIKPGLQGAFTDQISQYVDFAVLLQADYRKEISENSEDVRIEKVDGNRYAAISSENNPYVDSRWLATKPTQTYEWLKDYTNSLPDFFELNFIDDYDRIVQLLSDGSNMETSRSTKIELEDIDQPLLKRDTSVKRPRKKPAESSQKKTAPRATEAEPAPVAGTDISCTDCSNKIESKNWVDLSKLRFDVPLCKSCFNKR